MWISEDKPGDGKTPGIDNANTGTFYDTRWLYSTDFIKLKNVTLTYRIPVKKVDVSEMPEYIYQEKIFLCLISMMEDSRPKPIMEVRVPIMIMAHIRKREYLL